MLHAWYRRHYRDLPWRRTRDPYRIWISEVMLQQTRVDTALHYYEPFLESFPGIRELADAPESRVLAAWSGLGYYTRARNLKRAAEILVREHGGGFPREFDAVVALPGIGRSSAGSILSIAFDDPWPVLDGNVARVLQRLHATGGAEHPMKVLWQRAGELLPRRSGGVHSQAMMELGARVCTPSSPRCGECPVARWCAARARGVQASVPAPRVRAKSTRAEEHAAVAWRGRSLVLERRTAAGPLQGMVGLPLAADLESLLAKLGRPERPPAALPAEAHAILERRIRTHVWEIHLDGRRPAGDLFTVSAERVFEQPLDGTSRKILRKRRPAG